MSETISVIWPGGGIEKDAITRTALELVGVARTTAAGQGSVTLVAFAPGGAATIAAGVTGLDLAHLLTVDADLEAGGDDAYIRILTELVRRRGAATVVLPGDARGRAIGARLAARVDGCAINDVIAISVDDEGHAVWSRPCFGGKAVAEIVARRSPTVVTVRPRAFEPVEPGDGDVPSSSAVPVDISPTAVRGKAIAAPAVTGQRLEDAALIVAGGRGMGSRESYDRLGELAALLGGSVGCTGAAIDEGWGTSRQKIGLTGQVVSPQTYLAIGISGAGQHLAGVARVRTLVAINIDSSAPIFDHAKLGVVMDADVAVPALIAELRRLSG